MLMFPWFNPNGRGGGTRVVSGSGSAASDSSQPLADYVAPSPEWSESLQLQAESYYSNSKGTLSVKARAAIILGFLLLVTMAFGQGPDSFVYVKQFPGVTVGQKVAAAQQTCTTNTAITCYLAIDPSLAVTAPGVMPTLCSHCVLYDWRAGIPGVSNLSAFIQSLDPSHLPVTQDGGVTDLNLVNVDKLDKQNTHSTGTQTVLTGASNVVGRKVQGIGTQVGNLIGGTFVTGACWSGNVAVGEFVLAIEQNMNGGLKHAITPTQLGNTVNTVAESNGTGIYWMYATHAGAEQVCVEANGGQMLNVFLLSGINPTSPIDTYEIGTEGLLSGLNSWTDTLSPSSPNEVVIMALSGYNQCTGMMLDAQFTPVYSLTNIPGTQGGLGEASGGILTTTTGGPLSFASSCFDTGSNYDDTAHAVVALKSATTFQQGADFDQWLDANANVLSRVDANGAFNPPQVAGVPGFLPHPGALAYDTANDCERVYDAVNGWTCLSITPASSSLTAGTNGYYRVEADGTITDYVNTGTLNNNTPTTVTLPHSFPSLIASIVCSDNGGRVQAGNDQNVGANVVGLSAPYSSIYVNTPATGMSAYCIVVGK